MVPDSTAKASALFKPSSRQLIMLAVATSLAIAGAKSYKFWQSQVTQTDPTAEVTIPEIKTVTALGRLEPKGKVIKLSAPSSGQGIRVENLLVKEGDQVKAGQSIAILDNRDGLQAALEEAEAAIKVAKINLEKIQAGAKVGEIEAQKAEVSRIQAQTLGEERQQRETVTRLEVQWQAEKTAQQATVKKLEAELKNAQAEFQRYEGLYSQGAISQSLFDSKGLNVDITSQQLSEARAILNRIDGTGRQQISEAKTVLARIQATGKQQANGAAATLDRITEVRPVDVAGAKAEVNRAMAAGKQAKANLDQAYIRSPQDGVIFHIHTRAGEIVSNQGIVEIGQTKQMYAVVEIYQSDVNKVKPQQRVRISSNSVPGELLGTIDWVGWKVQRQSIINSDPAENIDSRVVEAHVQLDEASSQKAAKFTNLQVKAVIEL
ncbi:HlyD family efflux transporter periplasmic adaptor subunit [Umezakia ovalisporum]|jgi:HlyD family secretion protein|uniref:Biotin/lipoyl-binding protein n=2 Tax=Umezakia ovalisporum TaxID=75695 RepID=A0AA43KGJ5_9CYAN|nr:HlyD family efflux transporter periplasmic adaptor subunit [Umezakia ovalisporum]MBI1241937.1 biotin/lipoyl-binding protein [Nostoc sp. RI_552]MDH6058521.1 biotin/lipoyl-binding protein [Umezakia ovalisporum FSS-43]MDH6064993.1 biotin/lipoyl-binding protein [Umezakia ovalisporum FSS-62]MDH6067624.1 biotin/lipoyl-binding protein [Umezakia ovalisporum APH033B]MDH6069444.1 biotin/lipoyl-binding protein [Umezakia ovalisporum CobakiLakeA]